MGHRSGKEQQVARCLTSARLMAWTRNLRVRVRNDQKSIEVDFGWRSVRLALEVSPFFTHGSREKQERDAERRRLLVANDWRVVEALDHDIATERAFARTTAYCGPSVRIERNPPRSLRLSGRDGVNEHLESSSP